MASPLQAAVSSHRVPGTPVGREPLAPLVRTGRDVRLAFASGSARLHERGEERWLSIGTAPDPAAFAGVRTVAVEGPVPADASAWLRALAATGVVLSAAASGSPVAWDPDVHAVAAEPLPGRDDRIGWERRSVRQRRAALIARREAERRPWPTVSAVLCTRRPGLLARALEQLAAARYAQLQVVVVCHGPGFPADAGDLRASFDASFGTAFDVELVHVDQAVPFGAALQAGCERAGGELLTKVDDDDEYGPWHVTDLVLAHDYSGATLIGKFPSAVYLEELDQTVWRDDHAAERYDAAVAGGTLLIGRDDFRASGGWRPVASGVDTYLLEAVRQRGGTVYRTHPLGYLLTRHSRGHTWQVDDGAFLRTSSLQWLGRFEGMLER